MIAPQELRLGNWININGNPFQLELPDFNLIVNENGKSTYEPIELNEDWLLKLGFEAERSTVYLKLKYSTNVSDYVLYDRETKELLFVKNNQLWLSKQEYVHQLQNLYYCLCGRELII